MDFGHLDASSNFVVTFLNISRLEECFLECVINAFVGGFGS